MLDEVMISKGIIETYSKKFTDALDIDVAIVGGGPSGIVAGYYLAKAGMKAVLFEKKISIGGGIWGGGMMFNEIVVQDECMEVLSEFGMTPTGYAPGYYTIDSVYMSATLVHKAMEKGLRILNMMVVEDTVIKNDKVAGLVINWGAVDALKWHVDPLTIHSRFVLDATGHPSSITELLVRKMGVTLNTPTGGIIGEKPMTAEKGEQQTVENTKEVYPGLFVSGMAANNVFGGHRMGPIFGGMLLSGKKAAEMILEKL